MTIKELKEVIENCSDDTIVFCSELEGGFYSPQASFIVDIPDEEGDGLGMLKGLLLVESEQNYDFEEEEDEE